VTPWPVDPFTGLAFGESIVAGPYVVRYLSNYILWLDRLKELVADCAATKESIRVGFETKHADKALELYPGIVLFHKYYALWCHLSHKPGIA
jgi:hypothetical protein